MHAQRLSTFDFERLLLELVERLAADYEAQLDIGQVVKAVWLARDEIGNLEIEAPDGGVEIIEQTARRRLDGLLPGGLRQPAGGLETGLLGS